jgi:LysM repeat protein
MAQETWHVVQQGEWLSKIASQYGLPDGSVIWNDSHNADLVKIRPNPNILFPGDNLFIPEPTLREESRSTDKCHEHVVKTFSNFYELTLFYPDGTPIKNQKYILHITDPPLTGTTDANGHFKHENLDPEKMQSGLLELPDAYLQLWIDVGGLNPAHKDAGNEGGHYDNGLSGIQMRLANLGYDPGATDGRLDDDGKLPAGTRQALALFQAIEMGLPGDQISAELDDNTRQAIISKYGH